MSLENKSTFLPNLSLLILRLGLGLMMAFGHGVSKMNMSLEAAKNFPDPLGVGSQLSWMLATGAEIGCSVLLVLGLFTRLAVLPLIFTMLVAVLIVHGSDPFAKKELALLYLVGFQAVALLGAGKYSFDYYLDIRKTED